MSSNTVFTPDGMVFSLTINAAPVRLREAMVAADINLDRSSRHCEWGNTSELRVICDEDFEFTILNTAYTNPATAVYTKVEKGVRYPINVGDAHDKVYFKSVGAATLVAELYGATGPFSV